MSTLFPWTLQLHSKKHRWDYNTEIKCWVCFLWIKLHLNIKQFPQIAYLSLILFFNMYELCVIRCLMTCQTHRCYADVFKRVVGQISRTVGGLGFEWIHLWTKWSTTSDFCGDFIFERTETVRSIICWTFFVVLLLNNITVDFNQSVNTW